MIADVELTLAELVCWLLGAPSVPRAVATLDDEDLCQVSGYLGRCYDEDDATGMLYGVCLVEGHRRFKRDVERRTLNVGHRGGDERAIIRSLRMDFDRMKGLRDEARAESETLKRKLADELLVVVRAGCGLHGAVLRAPESATNFERSEILG